MRRFQVIVLAFIVLAALALASVTSAAAPIGDCAPGFHLHALVHDHNGHVHNHVGSSFDQNGDGLVCVKHVSPDGSIHVHADNVIGE